MEKKISNNWAPRLRSLSDPSLAKNIVQEDDLASLNIKKYVNDKVIMMSLKKINNEKVIDKSQQTEIPESFVNKMIKLSNGFDSSGYLNDFWSMTERVGRSYLGHIMQNRDKDFKVCEFKCPNKKKPKPNTAHLPTPNGCGSYDFRIDFDRLNMHDITKCCDEHDTCYATCNKKKQDCDNLFRKCLLNFCDVKQKQIKINLLESVCLEVANFMHDMVKMFGCPVYGSSQKSACHC